MKKVIQDKSHLLENLSILETGWKDDFAVKVIDFLKRDELQKFRDEKQIPDMLENDFEMASTVFRLFLEKSKDEYTSVHKELIPEKGKAGKTGFMKDKKGYVEVLRPLLLREKIRETMTREYTWEDILIERLKAGRGSAIKGQKRGRDLENFVENIVRQVFDQYDPRCSFRGIDGSSTEKADFAIPSKWNPEILIEVKGYGATGSKQTDVLGDVNRIIQEKRHDTVFILFTDGITWKERENDFKKLVDYQNQGFIYKIYTKKMHKEFLDDLRLMKQEKNL